jgi:hypothetical protein
VLLTLVVSAQHDLVLVGVVTTAQENAEPRFLSQLPHIYPDRTTAKAVSFSGVAHY